MAEPSPQIKYYATNPLKQAHTSLHRAIHNLEYDRSEIEAKRQIADVIRKATEALANLWFRNFFEKGQKQEFGWD